MSDAPEEFADYEHRGETEFMEVFAHPSELLLVAVRKQGVPFPAEDVLRAHKELESFAPQPQQWVLLIDPRRVTGNNDARFEAAIARVNDLLLAHFLAIGVLVRSHIGQLHATRLSGGERTFITSNAEQLIEQLLAARA